MDTKQFKRNLLTGADAVTEVMASLSKYGYTAKDISLSKVDGHYSYTDIQVTYPFRFMVEVKARPFGPKNVWVRSKDIYRLAALGQETSQPILLVFRTSYYTLSIWLDDAIKSSYHVRSSYSIYIPKAGMLLLEDALSMVCPPIDKAMTHSTYTTLKTMWKRGSSKPIYIRRKRPVPNGYVSIDQMASILGVNAKTIRRWISAGRLSHQVCTGGLLWRYLIPYSEVNRLVGLTDIQIDAAIVSNIII